METINWSDIEKIEMRVGTILAVKPNPKAHKPSYIIEIDFGQLGIKTSSAQLTVLYTESDLIGKQVIAVINFQPKLIAGIKSECLIMGTVGENNTITLLTPDIKVNNGLKIG